MARKHPRYCKLVVTHSQALTEFVLPVLGSSAFSLQMWSLCLSLLYLPNYLLYIYHNIKCLTLIYCSSLEVSDVKRRHTIHWISKLYVTSINVYIMAWQSLYMAMCYRHITSCHRGYVSLSHNMTSQECWHKHTTTSWGSSLGSQTLTPWIVACAFTSRPVSSSLVVELDACDIDPAL